MTILVLLRCCRLLSTINHNNRMGSQRLHEQSQNSTSVLPPLPMRPKTPKAP